jgi:hypothetical protein
VQLHEFPVADPQDVLRQTLDEASFPRARAAWFLNDLII